MSYPPVTQLETSRREAAAAVSLQDERAAARRRLVPLRLLPALRRAFGVPGRPESRCC